MAKGDPRNAPRVAADVRIRLKLPAGEHELYTRDVSVNGFSVDVKLPLAEAVDVEVFLPDGRMIQARAMPKGVDRDRAGFGLAIPDEEGARAWRAFVAEQEDASSLWTLIGRFASASGDEKEAARISLEKSPVGILFRRIGGVAPPVDDDKQAAKARVLRFHGVGENGEAYRIAFEKHGGAQPENSDLVGVPGFKALAVKVAARVLKQDVVIKRDGKSTPLPVRVLELQKGGYAYVHGGSDGVPIGFVSLSAGETILVEEDGRSIFPHFGAEDLERIACDTVKKEERPRPRVEASDAAPPPSSLETTLGLDALRRAQDASVRSTRHYENKVIEVFPQVWVQASLANGQEAMGPTLRDGEKLLVLILEGEGAPRIARLKDASDVRVLHLK